MGRQKPKPKLLAKLKAGAKPGDVLQDDQTKTGRSLESLSTRITTLDQLLATAKVDLTVWDVERFVVNKWEVGAKGPDKRIVVEPLFQVKAWLKAKSCWTPSEFRKELIAAMDQHSPQYRAPKKGISKATGLLYEISIFDHHVAKLCWHRETGHNYDINIAREMYVAAVADLVSRVQGMPIERFLFPIGNDFLHTDNSRNTTTAGTPQDVDGRFQRAFTHGREMIVAAVERLREIAPVEVIVVPGNHDRERMFYLGDSIQSWFRRDTRTIVDNAPTLRKFKAHGCVLLGFTHGDEEKHAELPRLMADEVPELWAKSRHREWHLGHFHKKKETSFVTTDTHGKTIVRVLPSLTGTDAWHKSKGFNSPRGSEAYLWCREQGYLAHYFHSGDVAKETT